jgi:predicted HicB family RNase H-like nuclease
MSDSSSNTLNYQGYAARIEFDPEDRIFVGRVLGIRDIVSFHGDSVTQLEMAFKESVDDYLAACEKLGQNPNKSASGRLMLRVPPEIHRNALIAARASGASLNQWASDVFAKAIATGSQRTMGTA